MADKRSLEFVLQLLPIIDKNLPPCGVVFCGEGLDTYQQAKEKAGEKGKGGDKGKEKEGKSKKKAKADAKKAKMEGKMEALLRDGWGFMESEEEWKSGTKKGKNGEKSKEVKVEDLIDLEGLDQVLREWKGATFVTHCEVYLFFFPPLFF